MTAHDASCLFCKIIAGSIPSTRFLENDQFIAIADIRPQAKKHFLVIPKKHVATLPDANTELVAALMTVSPGADTFLVVRNALRGGRRDGLLTVLGISSGLYFHAILSALGVSAVLAHSAGAFLVLKAAGAAYLAWLGFQSLRAGLGRHPPATPGDVAAARVPALRSFREGLLTNLLNAKVILFYLAFVPQFVAPALGSVALQTFILGLVLALMGCLYHLTLAALAASAARRIVGSSRFRAALDGTAGLLFLGFAARLFLTERRLA